MRCSGAPLRLKATITPSKLAGEVLVPASKSHTIRALLIATLAEGESRIVNPLDSADTRACLAACRALGAEIVEIPAAAEPGELVVRGVAGRLRIPEAPIDVMNSGTTLYLAAGVAAAGRGEIVLDGDRQTRSRPIQPLIESIGRLGAEARSLNGNGCAPVSIRGPLKGGRTSIEAHTSQYLSSLLLACPLAETDSQIDVLLLNEQPYAEMTLRWLDEQGISYRNEGFTRFVVKGRQRYRSFVKAVPGDFSSATFFACAAAITGSRVTLRGLDLSDSQGDKAVLSMLERMGCRVEARGDGILVSGPGGEARAGLRGADLDLNATPDALPALAATACFASGTTRLLNVPQARLKETDRISVMREELGKMGARIRELPDGLVIEGRPAGTGESLSGAEVSGHDDHRVVMALAIAGLGARGTTVIDSAEAARVTFPSFFQEVERLREREGSAAGGR